MSKTPPWTPFLMELAQDCAQCWHDTKQLEEKEKNALPAQLAQTWESMKPRIKANSKKGLSSFSTFLYMSDYNLKSYSPSRKDIIDMLPWELKVWHGQGILTIGTDEANPRTRSLPMSFNYDDAARSSAAAMRKSADDEVRAAKRRKCETDQEDGIPSP